jgi:hypothetical protein
LVDSKWVFKTKLNEKREVVKYKARIVAREFTQKHGIKYFDTYSPVAKLPSLRVLLTIVAGQWHIGGRHLYGFPRWIS